METPNHFPVSSEKQLGVSKDVSSYAKERIRKAGSTRGWISFRSNAPYIMKRYHPVNYDRLLKELQNKAQGIELEKPVIPPPGTPIDDTTADAKRIRKKALQNPEIRYIYSQGKVHDKDCYYVRKIKPEHFWPMKMFPEEAQKCDACYYRALVRAGLPASSTKDTGVYCDALLRLGVSEEELYSMTIQYRMQFSAVGPSRVQIAYQDDKWEICKRENILLLMHNNYEILDDYTRRFTGDFHLQKYSDQPYAISLFVKIMSTYSWDEHVEILKAEEAKRAAECERQRLTAQLESTNNYLKLKSGLLHDYYLILDCNGKAARYFYRNDLKLQELCYEDSKQICKLRMYRVRRNQFPIFVKSLDTLKEYSLQQGFNDYANQCVLKLREDQPIEWKKPGLRSKIKHLWDSIKRKFNESRKSR